jgi:glucokinase
VTSAGELDQRPLVGLDFGGTTIKGGVIRASGGSAVCTGSAPFEQSAPADEIYRRAGALALELEAKAGLGPAEGVGVGCAGIFHRATGEVLASANMQNLVGTSLSEGVSKALGGRHVVIENDANVAAYGEQWLGAGLHERDLILVTLGTGVGGGVVLSDQLFTGPGGNAGEVGHMVICQKPSNSAYDAPYFPELECACGSYGCLERLVSATAAMRRAKGAGVTPDLPELCRLARETDGRERALLHQIGRDLGSGLATLVTLFDVNVFAIGGGFGAALDVLKPGALESMAERRYGTREPIIVEATLGSDAGWIGAARLSI